MLFLSTETKLIPKISNLFLQPTIELAGISAMGRRKSKPKRSVGIVEGEVAKAQLNGRTNAETAEKDESFELDVPFFVEIDRSSWVSDQHMDISEIVLSDLNVSEEFHHCIIDEEFYRDSRYLLRFRVSSVNEYLTRIKLGHWPVLPASNICLEIVAKQEKEGSEENVVMVTGNFDGPDEGISGLVHLASLKFLTLRPVTGHIGPSHLVSIRLRVEILRSAFDACESLLDTSRHLWKKSMMHVMAWLRPEVVTSEARYGYEVAAHADMGVASGPDESSSAMRKCSRFDVASFYEAIKPSKEEAMLDDNLPGLLPKLRPYQRRAAYWMVQRERTNSDGSLQCKTNHFVSPLCMPLSLIDTSIAIYYNPFCGNLSLHPESAPSVVPGGILADEMGLGKTVELLACIFTHQVASSSVGNFELLCDESQKNGLKRLKRERVECICGSVSESIRYKGLWVQCDICDAWQHADCVGYSAKRKHTKSKGILNEQSNGYMRKRAKRKENVKVVEMEGGYICQPCSELIQATVAPVATGATLIVCPAPILPQWHAEIVRHTNPDALKTCVYEGVRNNSLSQTPLPDINELLSANIVLTTYDVLKEDLSHDSDRHEGDRRAMRFEKRYPVVPTLLTRILWWRICLDEAQMVENNAAAATEMALRLHGVHRWCITGTPIQRKLDDLFGLLRFLNASPFNIFRWWTDVIRDPYERGDSRAIAFTHDFFKHIMWRSSKVHVADELQLPPQEECVSWLSLSPIEGHFYQRQHETCVNDARELIESFKNDIYKRKAPGSQLDEAASDVVITNIEAAKLFNSLLKLRQACCHPQVGSSGLRSLQQSPMTMEEILSVLVSKTKVEGEEALRRLVVALNALAGIAIINQNYSQAVSLYQEALALAEDHAEDFRLDPLLNIHITHNLAEILPLTSDCSQKLEYEPGSPSDKISNMEDAELSDKGAFCREDKIKEESSLGTNADDPFNLKLLKCSNYQSLRTACEKLKQKFLSVFNLKLAAAQQEFNKSYDQVCNAFSDRKNQYTAWWLEALHHIEQNKDSSKELIRKIREAVSGTLNTSRASKVASCFRSITTLKIFVQSGLDSLENSRESLLVKLLEIDQTMGNPKEEDIARVRYCPKCYADADGVLCVHCELNDLFQVYEARLFRLNKGKSGDMITSAEEAVDLQNKRSALNRFYTTLARTDKNSGSATTACEDAGKKRDLETIMVSKAPSDLEVVLGLIKSNSRGLLDAEGVSAARKQMQLLEGMRKEYAQARLLATAQAHVLRAHDEIMMATSRLRLKEDENDKSIDALDPGELDAASAEWSGEKFFFLSSLSRTKGQLRYLKGLVRSKQTNHVASENATIGQATVVSTAHAEGKKDYQATIEEDTCPVCQEKLNNQKMVFQCGHVMCCKCLLAMTEKRLALHGKSHVNWVMCPTCRQHTDCRNIAFADDRQNKSYLSSSIVSENSEAAIDVQGSYSTKIEAITRRILFITSTNPAAKVLVFSSWNDVLDVLEHAFAANDITFVRMKGGRKAHVAISQFRGQESNVKAAGKRHVEQPETRSIQVLLLLIQHGANGLNLLEAQHVILAEPLLNPAAEAQAIGRVHRIGQAHKTLVHRFIVKDTVEESIYKLNKSRNIGSFVSGNRKNQDQPILTLKDVESLFRVAPSTDEKATGSLTHFPPSVAAAIAAERRLREQTSCQEPLENC